MRPSRFIVQTLAPFLSLAIVVPNSAFALRVQSPVDAGMEEKIATALSPAASVAGLEESATAEEAMAEIEKILKGVGVVRFLPDPAVLQDPALWKEALRQIPRMLQQNPHALDNFLHGSPAPLRIGWGLQLRFDGMRDAMKLFPYSGKSVAAHSALAGFLAPIRGRISAYSADAKKQVAYLAINPEGFFYQIQGDPKRIFLTSGFPFEVGLREFIQDRRLELIVVIHPEDDIEWDRLCWLLGPTVLRENVPVEVGKDLSVPVPMRGPGDMVLVPFHGFVSTVREDPQTGRTFAGSFTIRPERQMSFKEHGVLMLSKADVLLDYYRFGFFLPGHFGWRRPRIVKLLNQWFGEGNWAERHLVEGEVLTWEEAIAFYEEGYLQYFKNHPDDLEFLIRTASDVYDTARSNADPKRGKDRLDYQKQETAARHLQDIAIRRAVKRMGREFQGDHLVEIRGPKSEGFRWNPGNVPFYRPELIPQPGLKGWWKPGSIEHFWQSSRVILPVIKTHGLLEEATQKLAILLSEETLPLEMISGPLWRLSAIRDHRMPLTNDKIASLMEKLMQALIHAAPTIPKKFCPPGEWDRLETFLASEDVKWFASHIQYLPLLFDILKSKKAVPIFLARDALTMYEFGNYVARFQWKKWEEGRLLYQPGSPVGSMSPRASDPKIEHVLFETDKMMLEIHQDLIREGLMQNPRIYQELQWRFASRVKDLFEQDAAFKEYARRLYRQVKEMKIPPGLPLVVVDTNATGRTALFVKTVIELFSQQEGQPRTVDILLGWAREKEWNIPELRDFGVVTEEPFHDLHWPFRYERTDPTTGKPLFTVQAGLSRLLFTVFQSVLLYHAASAYVSAGLEEREVEEIVEAIQKRNFDEAARRLSEFLKDKDFTRQKDLVRNLRLSFLRTGREDYFPPEVLSRLEPDEAFDVFLLAIGAEFRSLRFIQDGLSHLTSSQEDRQTASLIIRKAGRWMAPHPHGVALIHTLVTAGFPEQEIFEILYEQEPLPSSRAMSADELLEELRHVPYGRLQGVVTLKRRPKIIVVGDHDVSYPVVKERQIAGDLDRSGLIVINLDWTKHQDGATPGPMHRIEHALQQDKKWLESFRYLAQSDDPIVGWLLRNHLPLGVADFMSGFAADGSASVFIHVMPPEPGQESFLLNNNNLLLLGEQIEVLGHAVTLFQIFPGQLVSLLNQLRQKRNFSLAPQQLVFMVDLDHFLTQPGSLGLIKEESLRAYHDLTKEMEQNGMLAGVGIAALSAPEYVPRHLVSGPLDQLPLLLETLDGLTQVVSPAGLEELDQDLKELDEAA